MSDETSPTPIPAPKKPRGFATLSVERRREIAQKGGRSAHALGVAHVFTPDEARAAGQKGGKAHSPEHMARIGELGRAAQVKKE